MRINHRFIKDAALVSAQAERLEAVRGAAEPRAAAARAALG